MLVPQKCTFRTQCIKRTLGRMDVTSLRAIINEFKLKANQKEHLLVLE